MSLCFKLFSCSWPFTPFSLLYSRRLSGPFLAFGFRFFFFASFRLFSRGFGCLFAISGIARRLYPIAPLYLQLKKSTYTLYCTHSARGTVYPYSSALGTNGVAHLVKKPFQTKQNTKLQAGTPTQTIPQKKTLETTTPRVFHNIAFSFLAPPPKTPSRRNLP